MVSRVESEMDLSDGGRLVKPGFHDGYMVGIDLLAEKEALVKLTKLSGERYDLQLSGVERLFCDGFSEGNIISEIYIISNVAPSMDALRAMMIAPHPLAATNYHAQHDEMLRQKSDLVEQGRLTFVAIVVSYGGDLHALCRSVELRISKDLES
jgi:hypothetical protein